MAVFNNIYRYSKPLFKFNNISLIFFLCIFFFDHAHCQWPASFTSRKQVRLIEGTVTESLHNIMPYEPFEYSEPNITKKYESSTKFYHKGMSHLYFLSNLFINTILKDQAYPEGFLRVVDGNAIELADVRQEWEVYVKHYGPTLGVIGTLVLLGVLMPLVGLVFCCCRCAGKCNARTKPYDEKFDFCRRYTYGMFLLVVTILISFGVFCAFVTNQNLDDESRMLPQDFKTSLHDFDLYINNTKTEISHLLINNFREFDKSINKILKSSGEIVKNKLGSVSKAVVLTNLTNIVHGLSAIRTDLSDIDSLTRTLQDNAEQLNIALREVRQSLLEHLNQCKNENACRNLLRKYNIKDLSLESNFTKLPNVTASLQNISELISSDIEKEVLKGKQSFDDIKIKIQNSVDEHVPNIQGYLARIRERLALGSQTINELVVKVQKGVKEHTDSTLSHVEDIAKQYLGNLHIYGSYRYEVGQGVSFILLTVLCCLCLGLLSGCCGSRPNVGYPDDCCNKGHGASFLMLGVAVMFLSSCAIALVTLIYFLSGVTMDRVVCEPLKHPDNSRIFDVLDQLVDVDQIYELQNFNYKLMPDGRLSTERNEEASKDKHPVKLWKLSDIVKSCHRNNSLFNVLKLRNNYHVEKLMRFPEDDQLRTYIEEMTGSIKLDYNIKILTPEAQEQLVRLSMSPLSDIDFPAYIHILGGKITSIDLVQLGEALNDTIQKLPSSQNELKRSLRTKVAYLKVHEKDVEDLLQLSKRLEHSANLLQEHLKFNHSSLRQAVDHLLDEVEAAQKMLDLEGPNLVIKLGKEFGSEFEQHVDHYLSRLRTRIEFDVGKCWPLSNVYNATINSGCTEVLYPYNGFWFTTGFCLLLFIPAIFLSVKLASLYQKPKSYPGPLMDTEYLYDAYEDREGYEGMPLANENIGGGGGGRKKDRKRHHHVSHGSAAHELNPDYSAHLGRNERSRVQSSGAAGGGAGAGASNSADPRFNDMALKNWDFPNGGPPHYQQSTPLSTEYERPPPYYFPGAVPK